MGQWSSLNKITNKYHITHIVSGSEKHRNTKIKTINPYTMWPFHLPHPGITSAKYNSIKVVTTSTTWVTPSATPWHNT